MSDPELHMCNLCEYCKAISNLVAPSTGYRVPFQSHKVKVDDLLPQHPTMISSGGSQSTASNTSMASARTPSLSASTTSDLNGSAPSNVEFKSKISDTESISLTSGSNGASLSTRTPSLSSSSSSSTKASSNMAPYNIGPIRTMIDNRIREEMPHEPVSKRIKLSPKESFNNLLRQKLQQNLETISSEIHRPLIQQPEIRSPAPLNDLYKSVFRPRLMRTVRTPVRKTSVLLPRYLRKSSYRRSRNITPGKETSNRLRPQAEKDFQEHGILHEIQTEVPGIELSAEGLNHLRNVHRNQVKFLHSQLSRKRRRTSASQAIYEENVLRQVQLAEMEQRNREEEERLAQTRKSRKDALKARGLLRDGKIQAVRAKRYYDQFHVQHKRKMSARKDNEEMLLQGLYEHRLALQRQQVHTISRDLRDQEQEEADRLRNRIASTNKLYPLNISTNRFLEDYLSCRPDTKMQFF